jgi:uncharacterized protein
MDENIARSKKEELICELKKLPSLLVAFSGGVDSAFLLTVAKQSLGDMVIAATARSHVFPSRELDDAVKLCRSKGIQHIIFESNQMTVSGFASNPPDRCYHCKKHLCGRLIQIAEKKHIKHIAHGINLDDMGDYRPGITAAKEMGILSPLMDARLSKAEIRFLSKEMGLTLWDKPATACFASRIPYGTPITREKLKMVAEAEEFLIENGFRQIRVRHHGSIARIETEISDLNKILADEMRRRILQKLKKIGFTHISVDMEGYVSGSMNQELDIP